MFWQKDPSIFYFERLVHILGPEMWVQPSTSYGFMDAADCVSFMHVPPTISLKQESRAGKRYGVK